MQPFISFAIACTISLSSASAFCQQNDFPPYPGYPDARFAPVHKWSDVNLDVNRMANSFGEFAIRPRSYAQFLEDNKPKLVVPPVTQKPIIAKGKSKAGTVDPDNRLEWVSLTYGSLIAYKNESRWTDTITATGKTLSEMEFRGKTDDYVELFNLNPAARDLIRLYKDRMECKHAKGWVVIGSGHWRTVANSTLVTVDSSQPSAEIRDVKTVEMSSDNCFSPAGDNYKSPATRKR